MHVEYFRCWFNDGSLSLSLINKHYLKIKYKTDTVLNSSSTEHYKSQILGQYTSTY